MLVGDFNAEPTKIPCLAKRISACLWVDLEVSWALAAVGSLPPPVNGIGVLVVVVVEILWLVALLLLLLCYIARYVLTGGSPLILLLGLFLIVTAGLVESFSRFGFLLSDLPLGCLLLI